MDNIRQTQLARNVRVAQMSNSSAVQEVLIIRLALLVQVDSRSRRLAALLSVKSCVRVRLRA
eukprot:6053434-Pleurochrysis_carterae.AAC.2